MRKFISIVLFFLILTIVLQQFELHQAETSFAEVKPKTYSGIIERAPKELPGIWVKKSFPNKNFDIGYLYFKNDVTYVGIFIQSKYLVITYSSEVSGKQSETYYHDKQKREEDFFDRCYIARQQLGEFITPLLKIVPRLEHKEIPIEDIVLSIEKVSGCKKII